jgi:hypothetical protein
LSICIVLSYLHNDAVGAVMDPQQEDASQQVDDILTLALKDILASF